MTNPFNIESIAASTRESIQEAREDRIRHERQMKIINRAKWTALAVAAVGAFVEGFTSAK